MWVFKTMAAKALNNQRKAPWVAIAPKLVDSLDAFIHTRAEQ